MAIDNLGPLRAYQQAARLAPPLQDGGEVSFSGMVQGLVGDTVKALRTAEAASAAQVAGKGDLVDVVTAIGAAETALETMVAVRDRAVSAYQEIMRMQI